MVNLERSNSLYIIFIAFLGAIAPISTDMYLAAIPVIAKGWNVSTSVINLSLVLWFAAFSIFVLVAGSVSDKVGRKPVLFTGLIVFVIASFMCAFAQSPGQLISARILQGIGAGAPPAMVMAIIRDRFEGQERHMALAYVMTIVSVAPMVAPIIGAMLLNFASWRFIFITQAILVLLTILLSLGYKETIKEKLDIGYLKLARRYSVHGKNRDFMYTLFSLGLLALPFYGFIAFSPIYYITLNGLSEEMFSLFFGINALSSMAGTYASSIVVRRYSDRQVVTGSLLSCVVAAFFVFIFIDDHYMLFLIFMSLFSFSVGVNRPLSGSIMLGLVETDVGSASSLLVSFQFLTGALCMALVTYQWANPMLIFGAVIFFNTLLVLVNWLRVANKIKPSY